MHDEQEIYTYFFIQRVNEALGWAQNSSKRQRELYITPSERKMAE